MKIETSDTLGTVAISEGSMQAVVAVIANIVDMACEHEPDLGLMRLVNFMDLYRTYLAHEIDTGPGETTGFLAEHAGRRMTDCVSFEHFIGDPHLLELAAQAASQDTGVIVAAPVPLKISANSGITETALA
ncbi:hypothetical protein ACUNV4_11590 [Granulosicoccus sp. 3-233]|uniref:hypothetical protein n=1 Tax=Granulosicoccus sp. 3-233 TaxID=3417969 RepID=UPI003D3370D1